MLSVLGFTWTNKWRSRAIWKNCLCAVYTTVGKRIPILNVRRHQKFCLQTAMWQKRLCPVLVLCRCLLFDTVRDLQWITRKGIGLVLLLNSSSVSRNSDNSDIDGMREWNMEIIIRPSSARNAFWWTTGRPLIVFFFFERLLITGYFRCDYLRVSEARDWTRSFAPVACCIIG